MKVLLTLAFVAMATALPKQQPEPISMLPLIIPPDIAQAFKKDLEINPPIVADADDVIPTPVLFVDNPVDVAPIVLSEAPAPEYVEEIQPSPVNVVDSADEVPRTFESAGEFEEAVMPVNVVEFAEDAPEIPMPIDIVESPVEEEIYQAYPRPFQFDNPLLR